MVNNLMDREEAGDQVEETTTEMIAMKATMGKEATGLSTKRPSRKRSLQNSIKPRRSL